MGLDVIAYKDVKLVATLDKEEAFDYEGHNTIIYKSDYFPNSCDEFVEYGEYECHQFQGFRAGSYGWYGRWRNELAKFAGYPEKQDSEYDFNYAESAWEATGGPFWELINFSDCEGIIGTELSKKLAKDFEDFSKLAETYTDNEVMSADDFLENFVNFREAFKHASENGFVRFL